MDATNALEAQYVSKENQLECTYLLDEYAAQRMANENDWPRHLILLWLMSRVRKFELAEYGRTDLVRTFLRLSRRLVALSLRLPDAMLNVTFEL